MDVLRPALLHIDGRAFRLNPVRELGHCEEEEEEEDGEEDGGVYRECSYDSDDSLLVEETDSGFQCSLEMPSAFFKYIIGRKGDTRRRLESETRCSLRIPRMGAEGPVVVRAESRAALRCACARVALLLSDARAREPWTHFLGLPLGAAPLSSALGRLRDSASSGACARSRGLHVSMFQAPHRLHLTLGTLVLLNSAERERARRELLAAGTIVREFLGERPLRVSLQGLEIMNDDPSAVDVVYARVRGRGRAGGGVSGGASGDGDDDQERLQGLADHLVEHFVAAGLMVRERDRVKLHATVVNSLYRRGEGRVHTETTPPPARARECFDARGILEEYGEFEFGTLCVPALHIYERGSTDSAGGYLSCGSLALPDGPGRELPSPR